MQQCNSSIKFITTYIRNQIDSSKVENEIIVKNNAFAIYEHERLLSTITQIQIMENHFVLMF
jgi:hypothetical protein